jgi:DNA-binding transcriptional LysR family regulator
MGVPGPAADPISSSDLIAFVLAFESGSVHGAAEGLGLTSSAVSKRLRSLEQHLGVQLFERGRFGLRPTAAAKLLYPEAKNALAALTDAQRVVREHRDSHPRSLSLATPDHLSTRPVHPCSTRRTQLHFSWIASRPIVTAVLCRLDPAHQAQARQRGSGPDGVGATAGLSR